MLSRFSSLFVYAVAGLVISAAAKPMGHLNSYDDGPKPPYPQGSPYSPQPKYPADKPYRDAKPYPPPDHSYDPPSNSENNCNVGQQHCCNPINKDESRGSGGPGDAALFAGILSLLELLKVPDLDDIKGSEFMGMDCSGDGDQCTNSQMCCTNNYFNGAVAVGCSPIDVDILPK